MESTVNADATVPAPARPAQPLRFRLFLLAASGLVPLALVLLVFTNYLARQRDVETQRAALELSRAIGIAIDAELRSSLSLLDNVATASQLEDLRAADLAAQFLPAARRLADQQGWRNILLADPAGRIVLQSAEGGSQLSAAVEPASLRQAIGTRAAVVGRVARGPRNQDAFAVRVPVQKGDQLRFVLSGVIPTERVLAVVTQQRVAPAWVVGVFDQDGNRVARTLASPSPRYSPTLEALVKASGGLEGAGRTYTLEGVPSHTGFTRLRDSGWIVAVGIPVAEAQADFVRLISAVGGGTALSLALLAWLAWRMARGISGPIEELKQAAGALGSGQRVTLPQLGVQELDAVAQALRQAGDERADADARRTRVEAEREQLLVRLAEALRQAEQANRNKDEFLALLGHELRNPLAPITNALTLMQLKGDAATAPERAIVQRQLKYVTRLVDDLLDASRITSKRFRITQEALQPVPVLEQALAALQPLPGRRQLDFRADAAARAAWVRADEARLVQVFNNVLGNAIKFTGDDGRIEVRAQLRGEHITFVFRDDGIGMAPEARARAFDLFFQAPSGDRAVNGGLGLGLAIVKSLVEMHGGEVGAESAGPQQGTTVTLSLPVSTPAAAEAGLAPPVAAVAGVRVLVVDDNKDAADTLGTLLDISGYTSRVVYTPQDALRAAPEFAPQVAILDIGLPGMTGYELARELRGANPPFTGRLVALTGYGQEQDVRNALDAGFDAHLTKPVAPEELLGLLAKLLGG